MKKIILITASIVALTSVSFAQEVPKEVKSKAKNEKRQKDPEQRAQKHVDRLNNMVTLTDAQKVKVLELATIKVQKADAIREKFKNDPEKENKMYPEMDAVKQDYHKSVKAILTAEQLKKLKSKQAELNSAGQPAEIEHE
jgi:vacuolar-type H+-ATPase subunit I/STV1